VRRKDHPIVDLPKGRKAVSRMKVDARAFAHDLFGGLGASELQQFVGTLDRVIARLEQLLPTPAS
jgi:DNA-binding MarR family transcriptional regulator